MIQDIKLMEKLKANNLLELVKWHKKTCTTSDCNISVYWILEDFERHMGRKATQKEFGYFM